MSRPPLPLSLSAVALIGFAAVLSPRAARADGAVLRPAAQTEPTTLDVEVAIAVTPYGATRWSRLTVAGPSRVMWLVPARPGGAIDLTGDAWLDALDDASAPRVASPDYVPPCTMPTDSERVETFGSRASRGAPSGVTIHPSANAARAFAAGKSFVVTNDLSARMDAAYAAGFVLASMEMDLYAGGPASTPVIRVSDDGGAILPLALTGSGATPARVTAIMIGSGPVMVPGMRDVFTSALSWSPTGSNYAGTRANVIAYGAGSTWIRESSAHEGLFDGFFVPRGDAVAPVVTSYFGDASCAAQVKSAAAAPGVVGRACAAGTAGIVPGGATCSPQAAAIDPATLTCGAADDLALALGGLAPKSAMVTRVSGIVAKGNLGADLAISSANDARSPVVVTSAYEGCPVTVPPSTRPGDDNAPPPASGGSASVVVVENNDPVPVFVGDGCGCGGTVDSSGDDTVDDSSSSDSSWSSSSSDSCDSSSTDSSSSSQSDSSSSNDGCGGSSDSSSSDSTSSSDDSSSDSSSSSSNDSCGSNDAAPKKSARSTTTTIKTKTSKRSPVSRAALFLAFLVLPLRRLTRKAVRKADSEA